MFLAQQAQSIQGIRQGLLFFSSRRIAAVNYIPLNKPDAQGACLSLSFKSFASHKFEQCNASQALRARCVVCDGELVTENCSSVVASFGTGGGIRTDLRTPPERSFTVGFQTTVYA